MTIPALFAKQDKIRRSSFHRRTLFGAGEVRGHLHRRQLLMEPLEERALLAIVLSGVPDWLAQGPSPAINGQTENIASTGREQTLSVARSIRWSRIRRIPTFFTSVPSTVACGGPRMRRPPIRFGSR
jgi:hypothetical protein